MRSGIERAIDRRVREWGLLVPKAASFDAQGRQKRDAYSRVAPPSFDRVTFWGFDVPAQEMRGVQHDIGSITRGDRHLFITQTGSSDFSLFQPERIIIDAFGIEWGIVSVENWTGKVLPTNSGEYSSFLKLQITRKVNQ